LPYGAGENLIGYDTGGLLRPRLEEPGARIACGHEHHIRRRICRGWIT